MIISFKNGYCVYQSKENGIVIATPHSGPAFENSTARDDNSETVASLCWKKLNGTLVVANIARKRLWGVDLNRDVPSKELALSKFNAFIDDEEDSDALYEYRKRYAWVAKDEVDYNNRLEIYENFWNEVRKGKFIILVHRALTRIKNMSSVMDIVVFNSEEKEKIKDIIKDVNIKYYEFLKKIDLAYKKMVIFEEERFVSNILRVFGSFDLDKISGEYKSHLLRDIEKIKIYSTPKYYKYLKEDFTPQNYLRAVKSVIENAPVPQITLEYAFDGSLAHGPKNKLLPLNGKIVIEVESSRFLNFWYPEVAADIINDIVNQINEK